MEATCTDLAVVKDIPGYKIIMKAVLKHQIQHLVEQLSETTGEQSVLLTASVSDGTFSHLGSEFGKNFLDGHDEIKAQFLAFLKSQQTKKAKQPFASVASRSVGMKKRKTAKTATSSKRSAAAIKSHPHLDNSTEEKNSVEESKDTVQEQSEGTAATIIEPSLGETTVKYAEPTLVENNLELSNEPMMKDSIKSDIYIYNAETSSDATQELTEKAVLTVTNGTENSTEKNIETLPVSDPIEIPVVGIPKLETSVSFPYQRVINCYAVLSDDLRTNLKMDNVIVKKEAGLDAKEVEGSDNDEGAILNKDDSDWEPNIKKRKKNSGSSARSSLKVPADQEGPRFLQEPRELIDNKNNNHHHSIQFQENHLHGGHQQRHGKIMFNCEFCGKLFKSKWHLTEHSRVHTGDKPYSCEICGKSFAVSANFKRHHNTLHIGRNKQKHGVKHFKCDVCEKFLRSKWHLANHIRIHTGDKPYSCEICGKSFTEKKSFKRHQLTYNHGRHNQKHGVKHFNCDVCQKTFGSKRHLTSHVRINTDDQPYSCKTCGRSFTENRSLKRHHITLHCGRHKQKHGIKQFKCDVCQKSFRSIWHLTTHVRIHTGDQPFSCEICGRSFTENSGLKRHRKIHTGDFKL